MLTWALKALHESKGTTGWLELNVFSTNQSAFFLQGSAGMAQSAVCTDFAVDLPLLSLEAL